MATKNDQILAQPPGRLNVELGDKVYATTGPEVFECSTIATLYKGKGIPGSVDVSVLKVKSKYRTTSWVIVDTASRVPKGTEVDLIGYPGDYTMTYLSQLIGYPLATDEEYNQVRKIVPANRLLVSHGKVVEENDRLVYKLSTTGGMSGGPVIYNNKVIGIPCGNFH